MLDDRFRQWLDQHADTLDLGAADSEGVIPRLAESGLLGAGVPTALGGSGGHVADAVDAIAQVASRSLTAAFVFWGQRAFIEFLLHTDNLGLRDRLLGDLLSGRRAGATGLSNAMKFLAGFEPLGVTAQPDGDGWTLNGRLPWVTNLRKAGFTVAAAVDLPGAPPLIVALPSDLPGLQRQDDLQLLGLQGSNTAPVELTEAQVGREWLLAEDARRYLPRVRPAFLALQCGLALGLSRRALDEVQQRLEGHCRILEADWARLNSALDEHRQALLDGLHEGAFVASPVPLFKLRIGLAAIASEAVQLELQASGGKAYLQPYGAGFARRLRESAFVPVVTPSLVQLRHELRKHGEAAA